MTHRARVRFMVVGLVLAAVMVIDGVVTSEASIRWVCGIAAMANLLSAHRWWLLDRRRRPEELVEAWLRGLEEREE